jgi:L-ascorbate metabolism protein UlaG (beta-lactamase superfamily)
MGEKTMKHKWIISMMFVLALMLGCSVAYGQNVKITPLGMRTGEFCAPDRALLFEDPTGVRILYDPGFTVAGGKDGRLGDVHVILLSHAHFDHLGSQKLNQDPDAETASCTFGAGTTSAIPNSNTAEIAAAKSSAVIAGFGLANFLELKIQTILGSSIPECPAVGLTNEMIVPRKSPCNGALGIGGKRTVRFVSADRGVQITPVSAVHGNELENAFLIDPLKTHFAANNLDAYVGVANGFVVTFTNGLKMYLSGDTGHTADMAVVVRGFYQANLVVFNISDRFVTGPEEAAFAVTRLIQPNGVIPSHANEVATTGGVVNPGTHTARFIELVGDIPVSVPLSGVMMEFSGNGQRLAGRKNR